MIIHTNEKKNSIIYNPQDHSLIVLSYENDKKKKYGIRGRDINSCEICGRVKNNRSNECNSHKLINGIEFYLEFGGYYETNESGQPLNLLTEKFLKIEFECNENLVREMAKILEIRFLNTKCNFNIDWGTWIPTTNSNFIKVAKVLFELCNISWFTPEEICIFDSTASKLESKYIPKPLNSSLLQMIQNKAGIILDDLYHKGDTMAHIIEIFKPYSIFQILGLTLVRTTDSKKVKLKIFPPKK